MKKSILVKIIINVLLVVCLTWCAINYIKLSRVDWNVIHSARQDQDYLETSGNAYNMNISTRGLSKIILISEKYMKNGELDQESKVTEKLTVGEIAREYPYSDMRQLTEEINRKYYNEAVYVSEYSEYSEYNMYTGTESFEVDKYVLERNGTKKVNYEDKVLTYEEISKIITFYEEYELVKELIYNYAHHSNYKYYFEWEDALGDMHIYNNVTKEEAENFFEECGVKWGQTKQDGKKLALRPEMQVQGINGDYLDDYFVETELINENVYYDGAYELIMCVDTSYMHDDGFSQNMQEYNDIKEWIENYYKSVIVSVLIIIILLICMVVSTGHKKGHDGIYLLPFDKWYTEAILVLGGIAIILSILLMEVLYGYRYDNEQIEWIPVVISVVMVTEYVILVFASFVRRIKAKSLVSNSIIVKIFRTIEQFLTSKGNGKKLGRRVIILLIVQLLLAILVLCLNDSSGQFFVLILIILQIGMTLFLVRFFVGYNKVYNGLKQIGEGNVDYKITDIIKDGASKEMSEYINNIGNGLEYAIESSLKSERLKTDLITNVSHDIKTPLTSIINYVELLKREELDNENAKEYIKVLEDKSERLKNLTEDLVEASKLSSGNIKLNIDRLNVNELIHQVNGEFQEKFASKNLEIVCNLGDEPLVMRGDGKRIWRILENIYNNAYKYSLQGTRVYVEATNVNNKVIIEIKNVSESPLNFDASELTERFIRGDISRSTEGSGLGLSIVSSLVALHGGSMNIKLDGDLFKIVLEFSE